MTVKTDELVALNKIYKIEFKCCLYYIVRLLRHTSDNNCALCDKSVKLATFEGIQMLNNSGYGGIAESTCIRNTRVLKKMLSQHFCSNKLF